MNSVLRFLNLVVVFLTGIVGVSGCGVKTNPVPYVSIKREPAQEPVTVDSERPSDNEEKSPQ